MEPSMNASSVRQLLVFMQSSHGSSYNKTKLFSVLSLWCALYSAAHRFCVFLSITSMRFLPITVVLIYQHYALFFYLVLLFASLFLSASISARTLFPVLPILWMSASLSVVHSLTSRFYLSITMQRSRFLPTGSLIMQELLKYPVDKCPQPAERSAVQWHCCTCSPSEWLVRLPNSTASMSP